MRIGIREFIFLSSLFFGTVFITNDARANSDKAPASESAPVARLEPFVVNLSRFDQYLQTTMTLQLMNANAAEKIKQLMPVIRHVIILTLSGKESADILTTAGKKYLIDELRDKLNKALTQWDKEIVAEIFLENFVVQ
ncbi:flagellar basal body-associated FliL family protein [Undibacterium flavidum]|nr:flagellar basal body-associated FliL family protein [Undibacterium flavidum]